MAAWFLAACGVAQAAGTPNIIAAGVDLFATLPGTTVMGVPFRGIPIGFFDASPSGQTDTIVQRKTDVTINNPLPGSGSVPIEMLALHLESVNPTDFGLGVDFYFVTLQAERGGPASTGSMNIFLNTADDGTSSNPEGTFDLSLNLFFDIRKGAFGGPVALSNNVLLSSSGSLWDANPQTGHVLIPGAYFNNRVNPHSGLPLGGMDFFPIGTSNLSGPGVSLVVQAAPQVPEPATTALAGAGLLAMIGALKRRRG